MNKAYNTTETMHEDYYQGDSSGGDDSVHILDYLQLLWFKRRLIIAITVFVGIIGFIQVNQIKNVYSASSTLMIGVPESQVVDIEQVLSRDYRGFQSIEEVEILRSRGLAKQVIEKLNLLSVPEFNPSLRKPEKHFFDFLKYLNPKSWIPASWKKSVTEAVSGKVKKIRPNKEEIERQKMAVATDIFLSKLDAESIEWSNVISINFKSLSPVLAARIANQVPESYIFDQLQAKFDATEKATAWLTEQLEELKKQLAESESAVEYYRQEHGITKSNGSGILSEQLSEVNSQLIIARSERAATEARLLQIKRLQSIDGQGIETSNEVLSSALIQRLRNQEAEVNRRASELAVEYGAKHPKMLQVIAEQEDIKKRIQSEIKKILQGLENEVEVSRTKERSLQASLREATEQSSTQDQQSVQLRALEREATANRVLYENFLNRFKETSSTKGIQASDARVISAAEIPGGPSYPNRRRSLMMILILGFMGSCGLVFAIHFMNPGIHSPEQIAQELGIHAIGMIPKLPGKAMPYDYLMEKPHSGFVEAINSLKISIKLSDPDAKIKALQVTSSVPEEGKSSLVLGLAIVMAKEGKKILVVDADLRRSSINKRLGLPTEGVGLTDYLLASDDNPEDFVFHHEDTGVDFMRTGDAKYANATDIFTSKRMRKIVETLKNHYDFVLFDTPPVMAVADAKVIGQIMDKTLFVVRWDKTPRKVARAALDQLHKSHVEISGIVLQQVDLKRYGRIGYGDSGYYYHYGRYGQYYQS